MRNTFIIVFIFSVISFSCFKKMAQSKASDPKDKELMLKRNFDDNIINQLKATQTVFFYQKNNINALDSFKEAISSGWDLTPIIFDDIDNFDKYGSDPKYSYFSIEGITTTSESSTGSYSNTHYFLSLRLFKGISKKGEIATNGLCRIELYPNTESMMEGTMHRKGENVINNLYQKGIFYNWSPILLKAQLEVVSSNLKNHVRPWLFENIKSDDLKQLLSADTLYVPKRLLMTFNKFSGKERNDNDNVFAGYKHNYRICSDAELYKIFQTEKRGRLLFEYVKSSTQKYVSVYDLKAGKVLYKRCTALTYNLKSKDIGMME